MTSSFDMKHSAQNIKHTIVNLLLTFCEFYDNVASILSPNKVIIEQGKDHENGSRKVCFHSKPSHCDGAGNTRLPGGSRDYN